MQNDNKKPQSGRKKGEDLTFKQLCWNCKRSTCPDGFYCPWADKGVEIKGWTATVGNAYSTMRNGKRISLGKSYKITDCPLFVKDKEYATLAEVIKEVADKLGIKEKTVQHTVKKNVKRYEKLTGKKMPAWVKDVEDVFGKD